MLGSPSYYLKENGGEGESGGACLGQTVCLGEVEEKEHFYLKEECSCGGCECDDCNKILKLLYHAFIDLHKDYKILFQ